MSDAQPVTDNQAGSRFEVRADGYLAELAYRRNGRRLVLIHTEVPPELAGRGIGGRLVAAAVDRAAHEGLTVVPLCPFARGWLERHPGTAGQAAIDWGAARLRTGAARGGGGHGGGEVVRALQGGEVASAVERGQPGVGEEVAQTVRPLRGEQRVVGWPQHGGGHLPPAMAPGQGAGTRLPGSRYCPGRSTAGVAGTRSRMIPKWS